MPSKQETFDRVIGHLKVQGRAFDTKNNRCMYRTHDGKKCAAGCLIPDDKYYGALEKFGATYDPDKGPLKGVKPDDPVVAILKEEGHDVLLVACLQEMHDMFWASGELMPVAHLQRIAKLHGLKYDT